MNASSLFSPALSGFSKKTALRVPFFLSILLLLLLFRFAHAVPPQHFVTRAPELEVAGAALAVRLNCTVDGEDGLRDLVKDGAVIELTAAVRLERKRSWWSNREISQTEYSSVVRHDPLTREFSITLPGESVPARDKNLTRLLHETWRKLTLPVAPLALLQAEGKDLDYLLTVSLTLQHTEVPPWLQSAPVFWSGQVVKPVTLSLPFSY